MICIHNATSSLLPFTTKNLFFSETKIRSYIEQSALKIDDIRKCVPRIQCAIDLFNADKAFTSKVGCIANELRYHHHTADDSGLFTLKEESLNRLQVLVDLRIILCFN